MNLCNKIHHNDFYKREHFEKLCKKSESLLLRMGELADIQTFSLKKDNRTRGREVTLVKDQCILDIRKYSFSQRTIMNGTNYLQIV